MAEPLPCIPSYGSFASKLNIPSSDLDVVVTGAPRYPVEERSPLQILASVLQRKSWLTTVHAIETAQVHSFAFFFLKTVSSQFAGTEFSQLYLLDDRLISDVSSLFLVVPLVPAIRCLL